ncbi:MAG: hypothetical protein RL398_3302 [Planctomycetota bacterium]
MRPATKTYALTAAAMLAFAANSMLCRQALAATDIEATTFTAIRLAAGAATLAALTTIRRRAPAGTLASALALFGYAAAFSFAYRTLPAGTGALLLFGAVQVTMVGCALVRGERLRGTAAAGFALAVAGVATLLLPGASAPPLGGALLMLLAGASWGAYSLRGAGTRDAIAATAGNFMLATPMALALLALQAVASTPVLAHSDPWQLDPLGAIYAALSGAVASGLGYAVWYTALRGLTRTAAATSQLSVPVLTALGGIALLDEPVSLRLVVAAVAILGGIVMVIGARRG